MTEPLVAQKGPFVKEMDTGIYAWCACGRSKNQPFCDGSHRGTGLAPLRVEIPQKKTVAWCGCKHSGGKPFCDGTHQTINS